MKAAALDAAAKLGRSTERPLAPPKSLGTSPRRTSAPEAHGSQADPQPPRGREAHELRPEVCADCGGTKLDVINEVVEEEAARRQGAPATARSAAQNVSLPHVPCAHHAALLAGAVGALEGHLRVARLDGLLKFVLLMPLDRIRRDLAERGIPCRSLLVTLVERAADILGRGGRRALEQLLAGPWMPSDGTALKVIVPELAGTHNGYIEVYRRDGLAVFQYEPDKAADNLPREVATYNGPLVADAEHRYNAVFETGCIIERSTRTSSAGPRRRGGAAHPREGGRRLPRRHVH